MNGARSLRLIGGTMALAVAWPVFAEAQADDAMAIAARCVAQPTAACVAAHAFALARTLPEDDSLRARFEFAERTLGLQDIGVALDFVLAQDDGTRVWEEPNRITILTGGSAAERLRSWIDIGALDRAILLARSYDREVLRATALIECAHGSISSGREEQAIALLDEAEALLQIASLHPYIDLDVLATIDRAATAWAGLGRFDRVRRLLSLRESPLREVTRFAARHRRETFVHTALRLARDHPAHGQTLLALAWEHAVAADTAEGWLAVAEAESDRRHPHRAMRAIGRALATKRGDPLENAAKAAALLAKLGRRDQAAKLVAPWREWLATKDNRRAEALVRALVPAFVALHRDDSLREVIKTRGNLRSLMWASGALISLGRTELAAETEAQAVAVAAAQAGGQEELEEIAKRRAGRGDVAGALDVIAHMTQGSRLRALIQMITSAPDPRYGEALAAAAELEADRARATGNWMGLVTAAIAAHRANLRELTRTLVDEAWAMYRTARIVADLAHASSFGTLALVEWDLNGGSFGSRQNEIVQAPEAFKASVLRIARGRSLRRGRWPAELLTILAIVGDDDAARRALDLAEIAVEIEQSAGGAAHAVRPSAPDRQAGRPYPY